MIFDETTWGKVGAGFHVHDCAFRSLSRQAFVLVEAEPQDGCEPRVRILFTYNEEEDPDERYYFVEFGDLEAARIAALPGGKNEVCVVDLYSSVYGHEVDERESPVPNALEGTELTSTLAQIARVGEHLYAVGNPRRVYRRSASSEWGDLTATLAIPKDFIAEDVDALMYSYSWKDACGFSELDMYVVGGLGEVWNFDGKKWNQCQFPDQNKRAQLVAEAGLGDTGVSSSLNVVCCAGDGNVFVGTDTGVLWRRLQGEWLPIGKHSSGFQDLVWFHDRLYLGVEMGLLRLEEDKLVEVEVPDGRCAGRIDVSQDGEHLLTSGHAGALLFDGKEWKTLFNNWKL